MKMYRLVWLMFSLHHNI